MAGNYFSLHLFRNQLHQITSKNVHEVYSLLLPRFQTISCHCHICRNLSQDLHYYYYYYYTIWISLITGLFVLVLLLNRQFSPPLRLQASHCSTFRIMCDFPSIAVFCSESIEYFPGTASKFFLKFPVTIPVAPIINRTFQVPHPLYYYYYYYCYYYYYFTVIFYNTSLGGGGTVESKFH